MKTLEKRLRRIIRNEIASLNEAPAGIKSQHSWQRKMDELEDLLGKVRSLQRYAEELNFLDLVDALEPFTSDDITTNPIAGEIYNLEHE